MKELLILLFLVLIFCIKLLRKNNENFESNEAPVIPNPLIKEKSKNIDSDYSDETGPKYYKNNPELKFRPTICDIKKSELDKGLPSDWFCYLDESGNKSYLYNMYLGEKKYIYHIDNDLKKLFDNEYKPHLETKYNSELDDVISSLTDKIPAENRDKNKNLLMYHILFNTNLMHRILNMYDEFDSTLITKEGINSNFNLKTLKIKNPQIGVSKNDSIKLIMDNLHKTYTEAENIYAINSDPIKACLRLLIDDTKSFKDFLIYHENKELSKRTNNDFNEIYKSTLGKQYNIIMDDYV